ncbi:hypothetical protein LJR219_002745 [Phenylobacterium sp. LjRoot219]|uniref:hypothetical protein n=1 Tax=Phenylobacterium sp. LjRoot219 TaxID=3342283 RepID=UPI003ECE70F4
MSTPVAGAGIALVAGLLIGAAMRPQLAIGELSPQPLGVWSGELPGAPAEDPGLKEALAYSAYDARLPDYVVGADWRATAPPPAEPAAPRPDEADAEPVASAERLPPSQLREAPAAEAHAMPAAAEVPAAADGAAASADPAAVPPIPTLADDAQPEPEATGDTSVGP